jgi:hypothetical protein
VTTGCFVDACRKVAEEADIELVDREGLRRRIDTAAQRGPGP